MKYARRSLGLVVLAMMGALSACAADGSAPATQFEPGLGIDESELTAIGGAVTYSTSGTTAGQMTITLADNDIALITRRSDGLVTINDQPVAGAYAATIPTGTAAGTAAVVKKITIRTPMGGSGNEHVVVDFINGTFSLGTSTQPGFDIDLGDGTSDKFTLRGRPETNVIDNVRVGATAINYSTTANGDTTRDFLYAGVETLQFTLGGGNDVFSAEGSATNPVLGAAPTIPVRVFGGDGNDTLRGGDGDDHLEGGAGNDLFWMGTAVDGADDFVGGAGTDTISYGGKPTMNATTNLLTAVPTSGGRTAAVAVMLFGETYCYDDDNDNMTPDLCVASPQASGDMVAEEGDFVLDDVEVVIGTAYDDLLVGGTGNDTLYGLGGKDTMGGSMGNDVHFGGDGDDEFYEREIGWDFTPGDEGPAVTNYGGPTGADVYHGGAGQDAIYYYRGAPLTITADGVAANDGEAGENDDIKADVEILRGGGADDTISGGPGDNIIYGSDGNDTIYGLGGNDRLYGGPDTDTLYGGDGDDVFDEGDDPDEEEDEDVDLPSGADVFVGGAGRDTVDYSRRNDPVLASADGVANDGKATVTMGVYSSDETDNIGTDVEGIQGSKVADSLLGSANADYLEGNGGADIIESGAGDDMVWGGDGADDVDCGDGDDFYFDDTVDVGNAVSCEL